MKDSDWKKDTQQVFYVLYIPYEFITYKENECIVTKLTIKNKHYQATCSPNETYDPRIGVAICLLKSKGMKCEELIEAIDEAIKSLPAYYHPTTNEMIEIALKHILLPRYYHDMQTWEEICRCAKHKVLTI